MYPGITRGVLSEAKCPDTAAADNDIDDDDDVVSIFLSPQSLD